MRRIVIAADHAGLELKRALVEVLKARGLEVEDLGTHDTTSCDYPDYAHAVSNAILEDRAHLGFLVCGTGVGMAMAANRHPGIFAVVCSEPFSAEMSRKHNDANVLCLGSRVVGVGLAVEIVDSFLEADFEGGRHTSRVRKIEVGP